MIEDIWGYDFVGNDRTLDVHISRLRERFPETSHSFKITTIRGLGYRLELAIALGEEGREARDLIKQIAVAAMQERQIEPVPPCAVEVDQLELSIRRDEEV